MRCPTDYAFDAHNVRGFHAIIFHKYSPLGTKVALLILLTSLDVQVKMKLMNLGHAQR